MQNQIYPLEHLEDSLERHLNRHSRRSQVIYLAILLLLAGGLAALPLVRVGVSVQSRGIIRPVTEKHEVKSQTAGFAERLLVEEGARVEKGDQLVTLRTALLRERLDLLDARLAQSRDFVHDLELLARAGATPIDGFRTPKYRQEYGAFRNTLGESQIKEEKALRELERVEALASRSLVPRAEAEQRSFELSQIRSERDLLVQRYRSDWQSALTAARMELRALSSERSQAEEEKALYRVEAPVTGTIEELAAISPGSYVQAGERIVVISPASDLVAEVYVSPRDIGLLQAGNPVRVLVDAFNYNDWGFVTGRVTEISDDFTLMGEQPVFRVGVALDQTELRLRNGFTGRLRKGMTLQARFMVAERSLLQLLRDDVNDWLNPVHAG